ncbi:metallophosphoesterase [Amphritea japonica]|uniref:Icc protein n=1 Tax=Amphritea japonica ATCC BAA-1530 TaxID=1278309 RepID=A0A7R6PK58_9GAMM|nr:metallophosphoesterase [Amphritea japonica]BBB25003.1 Icc protein [Amphritea japonica ATCC BAA-1530]
MNSLVIAQITDCHLPNDPHQYYRGIDVDQHLNRVVDDLLRLPEPVGMILWTGDLVHHGAAQGYQRLKARIAELPVPSVWIPGNHDDAQLMQQIGSQAGGGLNQRTVLANDWAIILLDSTSAPDGRGGGSLAQSELDYLQQQLQALDDRHCLVVLHHNPAPVESDWQDQIMLGNAGAFWAILTASDNVRGVINGHVHQARDSDVEGVRVMMTPSTSVQFKAGCGEFTLEDDAVLQAPAYRLLKLSSDGQIETLIKRVAG